MQKNELLSLIANLDGAVQIDTAEYVIPTGDTVNVDGEEVPTYLGVRVSAKRAVPTEKLPAFDLDNAVSAWQAKQEQRAKREAEKSSKPKRDDEAIRAKNLEQKRAILDVLGEATEPMTAPSIIHACGWDGEVSTQKVGSLCRQLSEVGTVAIAKNDEKLTVYSLS